MPPEGPVGLIVHRFPAVVLSKMAEERGWQHKVLDFKRVAVPPLGILADRPITKSVAEQALAVLMSVVQNLGERIKDEADEMPIEDLMHLCHEATAEKC